MQLSLTLLLATIASLELVAASKRVDSPRSSLQNKNDATKAYQRRQARSRDIVRRAKEGPRKRQASPVVCEDPINESNKIQNPAFDNGLDSWATQKRGSSFSFVYGNGGYNAEHNNDPGFGASTPEGAVLLYQTVDVCANGLYSFVYYSGLFAEPGTHEDGCRVTASIGGVVQAAGQPCSAETPCFFPAGGAAGGGGQFRIDSTQYTPTSSGPVEVLFVVECAEGETALTLIDNVRLERLA